MTRYVLIAISLLLAVSEFRLERQLQPLGLSTVTGAILAALVSGFLPAGAGYVIAWLLSRRDPSTLPGRWHWSWGVLLALMIVAHASQWLQAL
jgi:uncharacterized BrkB/YihY/UPF0761 family membrane protein